MKKALYAAVIATAMLVGTSAASAATLDINLQASGINQLQNGNVTQRALSAAAAIGNTANDTSVSSTAVSAVQLATMDLSVNQGDGGIVNGNGLLAGVNQTVGGAVDQASASLAGTGNLGAGSTISSTAANLGQSATMNVRVRH